MKLDFIIIGGQKCGSTYLHKVISDHPQINMLKEEIPNFESPEYEHGGLKELENMLTGLDQRKVIGIKRPSYLTIHDVKDRIQKEVPHAKLIAILRNPVERLKSAYFHYMNNGAMPVQPLHEGMTAVLEGKVSPKYKRSRELLEFGMYAKYLRAYKEAFDENILILLHDDLKRDKLEVIKKCYHFLEVDDTYIPGEEVLNGRPQKVNYSIPKAKLKAFNNKFLFSYNEDRTRLTVKDQNLFEKIAYNGIKGFDKLVFSPLFNSEEKPFFEQEQLKKIQAVYREDIDALEQLLSVDLSHWLKSPLRSERPS